MSKNLLLCCLVCGLSQLIVAQDQEPNYTLTVYSEFLVAGQFNASYDFVSGLRLNKKGFAFKNYKLDYSLGVSTDIFKTDGRMLSVDATLWVQRQLSRTLYLVGGLGAQGIYEQHALSLIEGDKEWTDTRFGPLAHLGLQWRPAFGGSQNWSLLAFVKQFNLSYTSTGLGVQYHF